MKVLSACFCFSKAQAFELSALADAGLALSWDVFSLIYWNVWRRGFVRNPARSCCGTRFGFFAAFEPDPCRVGVALLNENANEPGRWCEALYEGNDGAVALLASGAAC